MKTNSQTISAAARIVMVQEFGEQTTANLIAMGRTCAAEVSEADLETARNQSVLPGFEMPAPAGEEVEVIETAAAPEECTGELATAADTFSLHLTTEEAVAMANTLEKRCRKNNDALLDLIKRNIAQCVALGFVLAELRQTAGHGSWGKRFGKSGPGCFTFSRQTAAKYLHVATMVHQRAEERGALPLLYAQLRDMLEGRRAATLPVLENLVADATSLNRFIADLSMLPQAEKTLPAPNENPAAGLLSVDEMQEVAWASAAKMLAGWRTLMDSDWRKLNRNSRETLINELEDLLARAREGLND